MSQVNPNNKAELGITKFSLNDMFKGWFVGGFEPTAFHTTDVEVGVKKYQAGDYEELHHHKVATELTLIINGVAEFNGQRFQSGDIVVISPGMATDFRVIEDTTTVVVKMPGASNDKYLGSVE